MESYLACVAQAPSGMQKHWQLLCAVSAHPVSHIVQSHNRQCDVMSISRRAHPRNNAVGYARKVPSRTEPQPRFPQVRGRAQRPAHLLQQPQHDDVRALPAPRLGEPVQPGRAAQLRGGVLHAHPDDGGGAGAGRTRA